MTEAKQYNTKATQHDKGKAARPKQSNMKETKQRDSGKLCAASKKQKKAYMTKSKQYEVGEAV